MRVMSAVWLVVALASTESRAPPPPPDVDTAVRLPRVVRSETTNSARASLAIKELLAERVDVAHLPPRTPITIWREQASPGRPARVVGFRVDVDGAPFTALLAQVGDMSFCRTWGGGADGGCEALVDDDGVTLQGDTLASPVDAWTVSSRVGERIHPISHRRRFHAGTDYAAPIGTPVLSVKDGVVVKATRSWTAGRFVVVRHDDGSEAKYFHLDERLVEEKARVQKGDLIGVVGKTGRVTGPHLHFELRDARRCPVDMPVARWPGQARVDDDEARVLALRLRMLDVRLSGWPATVHAMPPARTSGIDLGIVVAELEASLRERSARRARRRR